ncbi:MAG TPA: DUF983 domain-containing protein [Acidimicrobiia bacterium]|nr:DUF983 domain-containing protein [Acidimicrobiia bacterium]
MIGRGLRRRCPRCGASDVFRSFFELRERCPSCGLRFEREAGYWVGAMIIITTVTFGLFILLLVGGILITWPDVPWNWLLAVTIGANLLVPILFYPRAKTLWAALELSWHPLEPEEIQSALEHTFERSE